MHTSNSVLTIVVMATIFNKLPCSNYCLQKKAEFWTTITNKAAKPKTLEEKKSDQSYDEDQKKNPITKIAFPKLGSLQENIPQSLTHLKFIILKYIEDKQSKDDSRSSISPARSQDDASSSVSKTSQKSGNKRKYFNSNLIQNSSIIWE